MIDQLREAVMALTHPQTRLIWQGDGHDHEWQPVVDRKSRERTGEWSCPWCGETTEHPDAPPAGTKLVKRTDEPLLDQLADAVRSDLGTVQSGRSRKQSLPIDVGALQMVQAIDERLRAWLEGMGARPGRKVSLRELAASWHVLYAASNPDEGDVERHVMVLRGWANSIVEKLQPAKKIELQSPCPVCGTEFVNIGLRLADGSPDPNDVEMVRALNAFERERLEDCYALCGACQTVWMGVGPMRELRGRMDELERAGS